MEIDSQANAHALRDSLCMGMEQTIATFHAFHLVRGPTLGVLIFTASAWMTLIRFARALSGFGPFAWLSAGLIACLPGLLLSLRNSVRVVVGTDGVLLRYSLGRPRFLSFASIASAQSGGDRLLLRLGDGKSLTLVVGSNERLDFESFAAMARRIDEARAAFATRAASRNDEVLLAPGGRPLETWLREVRTLASAQKYREAVVDPGRLLRVAIDAAAPAATRAGAALALAPAMGDDDRTRLRVASEACANPQLRVALLRVAEGAPPEDIDEAVAAVAMRSGPAR